MSIHAEVENTEQEGKYQRRSHENSANNIKSLRLVVLPHMGRVIIRPTTPIMSLFQSNGETEGNANATNMLTLPFMSEVLTCELDFSLSADDGPKGVGGDTLINPPVMDHMRVIYQQVSLHQAVVRPGLRSDGSPVHRPPIDRIKTFEKGKRNSPASFNALNVPCTHSLVMKHRGLTCWFTPTCNEEVGFLLLCN